MNYRNLCGGVYALIGALVSLAAVLAACGDSAKTTEVKSSAAVASVAANATTAEGDVVLAVTASNFAFTLNRPTVPAGRVHVQMMNTSTNDQHEVWMYPQTQPMREQMLQLKRSGQTADEPDYLQGVAGHIENVPAGEMMAFDVNLTPGTYELGCFITSDAAGKMMTQNSMGMNGMTHYDRGMHMLVTVQ